ncbi:MAG: hypothetical protein A4E62_02848 [Syntrophorhabdus sp. PtaU1.Bin002]|nr:MAG: hypothetical protein A4E62_02848 [Syntrophorhabdus sp. PtaU1.Bin002]
MPVHGSPGLVDNLHSVHTHVVFPRQGVSCHHNRECNESACIFGPAFHDRDRFEVYLAAADNRLLAGALLYFAGEYSGKALQLPEGLCLLEDSGGLLHGEERLYSAQELLLRRNTEYIPNPVPCSEYVDHEGDRQAGYILKKKGRTFLVKDPLVDLSDLKVSAHLLVNPLEGVFLFP